MKKNFNKLNNSIIKCIKCKRLVNFRTKISIQKRKQFITEKYCLDNVSVKCRLGVDDLDS